MNIYQQKTKFNTDRTFGHDVVDLSLSRFAFGVDGTEANFSGPCIASSSSCLTLSPGLPTEI
jgi:hypothetical protein